MKDLTRGGEARTLLFFAFPMLLGNVFQQMYNMVDSIVVGNFVGKTALAAVGASFPIVFLMVSLIMGLTMGTTVLVAQFYGAGDHARVRASVNTAYITLFWAGSFVSIIGVVTAPWILELLDIPADAADQAQTYLRVLFGGMLAMFGFNAVSAILRGLGDSKTPLYILILATLVNTGLDLLFVVVLGMGVAGVAWATVIAQGLSFVGALLVLGRRDHFVRLSLRELSFDREIFRQTVRIGIPTGMQQTLVATGHMVLMRIVNGFGTDVTAGFTAANRLDSFAMMPAMNLSQAVSAFTGQNIGAGLVDRVRRGLRAGLLASFAISALTGAVVIIFGRNLVQLFSPDPMVVSIGERYLIVVGVFYTLFSIMFLVNGVLRGAGDAMIPFFTTLLALWVVRVPCAVWFSSFMGPDGIWWAIPAGWSVGAAATILYYATGRWKGRSIAGAGGARAG